MKRMLSCLAVTMLALAVAPSANATDAVGIYFDEAATQNCLASATPYSAVNAYVLALNISRSAGMSGYEFSIAYNPEPTFAPSYTQNGGGLNALTPPIFQVGACTLPFAPVIKMITIQVLYMGGALDYYIGPCQPSSFGRFPHEDKPEGPGYADGSDPGILVRLMPVSNGVHPTLLKFYRVAGIASTCVVESPTSSWGSVKALYE